MLCSEKQTIIEGSTFYGTERRGVDDGRLFMALMVRKFGVMRFLFRMGSTYWLRGRYFTTVFSASP
jgi:hypothetical protein